MTRTQLPRHTIRGFKGYCLDCERGETDPIHDDRAPVLHIDHAMCAPDTCPVMHAMEFDALLTLPTGHTA